jgi:hypothetical protein
MILPKERTKFLIFAGTSPDRSTHFIVTGRVAALDDDDDVYLDKLQKRGVKKSILSRCET